MLSEPIKFETFKMWDLAKLDQLIHSLYGDFDILWTSEGYLFFNSAKATETLEFVFANLISLFPSIPSLFYESTIIFLSL